jgi:galactokinase
MIKTVIEEIFLKEFSSKPELIVNAPGRINLLGEHTDYNDGYVLPAAINKSIIFGFKKRSDSQLNFYSIDFSERFQTTLEKLQKSNSVWANFLLGVLNELPVQLDHGFDVAFGGNIPLGGGMSSSAALEVGFGYGINLLYKLGLSRIEIVKIAQLAEHNFAGVNCGIMDMYASAFGKKNHVLKLDCLTNSHEYFPLALENHTILLCNTGVKHTLSESAYNKRREECNEGLRIVQTHEPSIKSLRDLPSKKVLELQTYLPSLIFNRLLYVTQENERVDKACNYLNTNNLEKFGGLMYQTHNGLSELYEVSCKELDFLVDCAKNSGLVLGSRMMGGGFGGCTINIIDKESVSSFIESTATKYKSKFEIDLITYIVSLENGVQEITKL